MFASFGYQRQSTSSHRDITNINTNCSHILFPDRLVLPCLIRCFGSIRPDSLLQDLVTCIKQTSHCIRICTVEAMCYISPDQHHLCHGQLEGGCGIQAVSKCDESVLEGRCLGKTLHTLWQWQIGIISLWVKRMCIYSNTASFLMRRKVFHTAVAFPLEMRPRDRLSEGHRRFRSRFLPVAQTQATKKHRKGV